MLVLLLAFACHGAREVPPEPSPVPAPPPVEEPVSTAPEPGLERPDGPEGDSYVVTAGPTLDGTTLTLQATHGGGCAEHTFSLRAGPRKGPSLPLWLIHDGHGDTCRAKRTTDVSLSIAEFLADGRCTDTISLHAFPADGTEHDWMLRLDPPVGCE